MSEHLYDRLILNMPDCVAADANGCVGVYRNNCGEDANFVEVDPTGRYGRVALWITDKKQCKIITYADMLGKGAFKTVAFDEVDGIEVAWNQVKVQDVLQSPDDLERLYSEVHLLKTLKHRNIIKFYNSWVDTKTNNVNFITEIFTSGTLRQYRKRHRNVDIKAVKNWARQILRGLLYLHSHDPPIIHRDLKCDNIFVNGNQGEVKIGDLGLAAILRQAHAAHTVIGTPEFMAPELYEEEYNELVDIYSFGMCLLEMVTFEYPYSECTNAAQIYKKVTSGKKPAALDKVKDHEVRLFVDKCLATASRRLPARELLMDPFLQCEGEREDYISHLSYAKSKVSHLPDVKFSVHSDDMKELGFLMGDFYLTGNSAVPFWCRGAVLSSYELEVDPNKGVDARSSTTDPSRFGSVGYTDLENYPHMYSTNQKDHLHKSWDFRVKGKKREDDTIFLRLRIADLEGHVRNIHFPFDVKGDTAMSVASEMVAELDLSDQDVTTIAEMIDAEILSLVPEWKPGVACDDLVCIEGDDYVENNGFDSSPSYVDFDPLATVSSEGSMQKQLEVNEKLSFHPKQNLMSISSPQRVEATLHGRFEEIMYRSQGSDYCGHGNGVINPFATGCDSREDGDEWDSVEDQSLPSTPNSDKSGLASHLIPSQSILNSINTQLATKGEHSLRPGLLMAFNESVASGSNVSFCESNCEVWDGNTADVSGDCLINSDVKYLSLASLAITLSKRSDAQVLDISPVVLKDEYLPVTTELRLLNQRQQEELNVLYHRHEQALLEIKNCYCSQGIVGESPVMLAADKVEDGLTIEGFDPDVHAWIPDLLSDGAHSFEQQGP